MTVRVARCGHPYFSRVGRTAKKCPDCQRASEASQPSADWWQGSKQEARFLSYYQEAS